MIKTLLFSVILALASYALFPPRANAQSIEAPRLPPAVADVAAMAPQDPLTGRGRLPPRVEA